MKKSKSIFFKNFMNTVVLLLLSFVMFGAAFTALSYRYIMDRETTAMQNDIHRVAKMLSAYGTEWDLDSIEIRATISLFSDTSGFHVLVCDGEGTVVSCSDRELYCPHLGQTVPDGVLAEMDSGEYYGVTALGGIYERSQHVAGSVISSRSREDISGYVFLSAAPEDLSQLWEKFAGLLIMIMLIVIVLACLLTYVTTYRQTEPIKRMAAAAHRFGYGDFSVRVADEGTSNEIRELADAFNVMAETMERSEQAWRDLIANVAHELKTPMTTITGFADGILDGTIPPESRDKYIGIISSETKRLNRLVRGMLQMSRMQDKNAAEVLAQSFDVTEIIRRALVSLEGKITAKGLDVDVALPEEAVMVRGDSDAIMQVVYNLVDNAAKFADPDTTLRVAVWKQESKAYVSVEDTGPVIAKEELPRIFDRFHKEDRSRSRDKDGVGLGLFIVKTIINRHNEDIFVTSEEGVTRFVFTLALKEAEARKKEGGKRGREQAE